MDQALLSKRQAAALCGLSVSGFSKWISSKKMPGPLPGTRRWCADAIHNAISNLQSGGDKGLTSKQQLSPIDQWFAANG